VSDPLFPIPIVRQHAVRHIDEFGETWVTIDGIETKVPSIAAAKVLLAKQDGVRVAIRAALDETGIRDKTITEEIMVDGEKVTVELVPPALADVFQIDLTRQHVPSKRDGDIIEPVAFVPPPKLTRWQRIKRAAKRLLRRKKGRTR